MPTKITDAAVKVLLTTPAVGKDRYLFDSELRGFFAKRNHTSGEITWGLQYKYLGRNRRYTIGRTPSVGLELARRMARQVHAEVVLGSDPASAKIEKRQTPTFDELCTSFMDDHVKPRLKPNSVRSYEYLIRKHLKPGLGSRKAAGIERADITRLHQRMSATPSAANRCARLLHKLFEYAEALGWRPNHSNPCAHLEHYKEGRQERFLNQDELGKLGDALKAHEKKFPSTVLFLRMALLTGCRKSEILTLRWDDVDLEAGELHLRDAKRGPRTVHLGAPATLLLSEAREWSTAEWVCPGRKPGTRLSSPDDTVRKLFDGIGLNDFRIHDLRHTYASFGVSQGLSLPLVGALLGHVSARSTEKYAHLAAKPVKQAADQVTAELSRGLSNSHNS